jgi:hypothetical protein
MMLPRSIEHENPVRLARAAGVFYVLQAAFGPAMLALKKVFVATSAAQTTSNLVAHAALYNLGFTGNLIAIAAYIVVTGLFYALFRPVNRNLSFLAACFSLTGCAVLAMSNLFYFAPMIVLTDPSMGTHGPQVVMMFLKLYAQGYNISLVFFAFYCSVIGWLIFKSGFLPRVLGVGMMAAGIGWLAFLSPPFARSVYPYVMIAGIGEAALTIWLLASGVNRERWLERAAA